MQAPGAGKYPTATAILEDLVCIAKGRKLTSPPGEEKILLEADGQDKDSVLFEV